MTYGTKYTFGITFEQMYDYNRV